MRTFRFVCIASSALLLCGCAGTLGQIINRPITSDKLDEPGEFSKLKTVSGDMRLVRVVASEPRTDTPGRWNYDVCAETQADAIITRSAGSSLSIETGQSLSDAAAQGVQLTNARTAISDVVRHLAWNLCSARLNDDLNPTEYKQALLALSHNAMVVLQQVAMGAKPETAVTSSLSLGGAVAPVLEIKVVAPASSGASAATAPAATGGTQGGQAGGGATGAQSGAGTGQSPATTGGSERPTGG